MIDNELTETRMKKSMALATVLALGFATTMAVDNKIVQRESVIHAEQFNREQLLGGTLSKVGDANIIQTMKKNSESFWFGVMIASGLNVLMGFGYDVITSKKT